jgi:hypothetical protein
MDSLNQLVSPEVQAVILQGITFLTLLMPLLEKLVAKTSNKVDDRIVAFLEKVLAVVPRVRLGGK